MVVLGRDPDKGRAVTGSSGGRGTFLRVDLDSVAATRAAIARIRAEHPVVDTLVFCARYYRSRRTETVDGLEATFAHFYLSRFLFGHGLAEELARAPRPLIVNVAGPGGPLSAANLGDLQARRHYHGGAALGQGGKLNDLLGVAYAQRHPDSPVRYLLVHPGVTATAVTGSYDRATLAMVQDMRQHAKPVAAAADPILALIDARPPNVSAPTSRARASPSPGRISTRAPPAPSTVTPGNCSPPSADRRPHPPAASARTGTPATGSGAARRAAASRG